MRTTDWYKKTLTDYFYKHYPNQVNESRWFVNPSESQFKGYLPDLRVILYLTCDEDGNVTEEKQPLNLTPEMLHEVMQGCVRGMDAVYEDYVIYLVGREGFDILRNQRLLESCGSINGRRLYTVAEGKE